MLVWWLGRGAQVTASAAKSRDLVYQIRPPPKPDY